MPLTIDEFLEHEPTVVALEREYAGAAWPMRRKLGHDLTALRKMLISRWEQGVAGWLTRDEAQTLAAELDQIAADRALTAWALVEDRSDGVVERPYLVLAGGSQGEHVLDLRSCNPVRARAHWLVYLEHCSHRVSMRLLVGSER